MKECSLAWSSISFGNVAVLAFQKKYIIIIIFISTIAWILCSKKKLGELRSSFRTCKRWISELSMKSARTSYKRWISKLSMDFAWTSKLASGGFLNFWWSPLKFLANVGWILLKLPNLQMVDFVQASDGEVMWFESWKTKAKTSSGTCDGLKCSLRKMRCMTCFAWWLTVNGTSNFPFDWHAIFLNPAVLWWQAKRDCVHTLQTWPWLIKHEIVVCMITCMIICLHKTWLRSLIFKLQSSFSRERDQVYILSWFKTEGTNHIS